MPHCIIIKIALDNVKALVQYQAQSITTKTFRNNTNNINYCTVILV